MRRSITGSIPSRSSRSPHGPHSSATSEIVPDTSGVCRKSISERTHDMAILGGRPNNRQVVPYLMVREDRKSTRLNSSHGYISYAVFCLKKKKQTSNHITNAHIG